MAGPSQASFLGPFADPWKEHSLGFRLVLYAARDRFVAKGGHLLPPAPRDCFAPECSRRTSETLRPGRGALLVRQGKGGRRREVGRDDWGSEHLRPWLDRWVSLPIGPLFCVIDGPTRGRPWTAPAVRIQPEGEALLLCSQTSPFLRWPAGWLAAGARGTEAALGSDVGARRCCACALATPSRRRLVIHDGLRS